MFLKNFVWMACLSGVCAFTACSPENKAEGTGQDSTATAAAGTDTAVVVETGDNNRVLSGLPPTSEVPALLQLSGADFNPTLVNAAWQGFRLHHHHRQGLPSTWAFTPPTSGT
jgi:hypothetical protein